MTWHILLLLMISLKHVFVSSCNGDDCWYICDANDCEGITIICRDGDLCRLECC